MPQPIHSVSAGEIGQLSFDSVLDVRSPAEFSEDSLPGAINLPVLNDAERTQVGTLYKQVGPFEARRLGAGLVSANIAAHLAGPLADQPRVFRPLIYCWRGGERSRSLATVLSAIGWKVALLDGGYRAYRRFVVEELKRLAATEPNFEVIAGLTGSGKTVLLQELAARGAQVLDLEGLAEHRGSALGESLLRPQPCQRRFEGLLYEKLRSFDPSRPIYTESESSRIGKLQVPAELWARLRAAPLVELQVPLAARADHLMKEYQHFVEDRSLLSEKLEPLRRLQPKAVFEAWEQQIEQGEWLEFVTSILRDHYDPAYLRSRAKIYSGELRQLAIESVEAKGMAHAADDILGSCITGACRE